MNKASETEPKKVALSEQKTTEDAEEENVTASITEVTTICFHSVKKLIILCRFSVMLIQSIIS